MNDTNLKLSEAVLLGTAYVQDICRRNGIQALFLKGPAAIVLGVRPESPSSDIDVLISKANMDDLVALLKSAGWAKRGEGWEEYYSSHSVTMFHHRWPCDIDIHYRFPGISASDGHAFITLFEERQSVQLAGHNIDVPGPLGSVCIQSLHALRNPWVQAQQGKFKFLIDNHPAPAYDQLLDFVRDIDALAAMKPYFAKVYNMPDSFKWPAPSREWIARTSAKTRGSIRIMELLDAPWKGKMRILRRQLTPSAGSTIEIGDPQAIKGQFFKRVKFQIKNTIHTIFEVLEYLRKRNRSSE